MPWAVAGAVIEVAGSAYAANKQSGAAKDAATASQNATNATIAEQQREFNITQQNLQPWLTTGTSALNQLAGIEGLNGQGGTPDYSAFYSSPDYLSELQQGQQALDRSAAAKGSLYSGGHEADTLTFGQNLAAQQFGNYWNRLAGLAGVGQQTAGQLGQFGSQMAGQYGQAQMWNAGNQMNSSYNQANASTNLANQVAGIGSNLAGQFYNPGSNSAYTGNFGNSYAGNAWDSSGGVSSSNYLNPSTYAGLG